VDLSHFGFNECLKTSVYLQNKNQVEGVCHGKTLHVGEHEALEAVVIVVKPVLLFVIHNFNTYREMG